MWPKRTAKIEEKLDKIHDRKVAEHAALYPDYQYQPRTLAPKQLDIKQRKNRWMPVVSAQDKQPVPSRPYTRSQKRLASDAQDAPPKSILPYPIRPSQAACDDEAQNPQIADAQNSSKEMNVDSEGMLLSLWAERERQGEAAIALPSDEGNMPFTIEDAETIVALSRAGDIPQVPFAEPLTESSNDDARRTANGLQKTFTVNNWFDFNAASY
ncbi:hypothetical protein C0991_009693 [Blastosporella zonata]|nr:hypothetical protein C0991_009693 [Blastosporella zonata]